MNTMTSMVNGTVGNMQAPSTKPCTTRGIAMPEARLRLAATSGSHSVRGGVSVDLFGAAYQVPAIVDFVHPGSDPSSPPIT